jgi:outer membrane protein OmpA-like peptidoglycan-associated protein
MDLTYAMGFGRFGLHAQLPLILHQSSDFGPSMGEEGLASGGVGDLRIGGKAWLFRKSGLTLGADLTFSLPTNSGSFTGDAGTVIEPRGLVTWRSGKISVAGSLGYGLRTSDQRVADLHVDDELLFAVAGEYAVLDKLGVGLALTSRVGVIGTTDEAMMDSNSDAERLSEVLASTRYWVTDSIAVEGGLGTALETGYGAPAYRVLAGVRWTHKPKDKPAEPVIADTDHDGIYDPEDGCVTDPEDKDSFEDTDGCPEDDDKDGIADAVDECRAVPEDADGVEDDDGCPEDDDKDGIADAVDECRTDPEDPDGFEDDNGCPDPDNDQDTVLDADDQCPIEQETLNGFEDENGCPDERPAVVVTTTAVEINETIYFDLNKAKIKKKSFKLLDAVAKALTENPDIRVKVEGHTDDTGTEAWNQELSELRAKAVMDYLVKAGVAADRLESAGYGASVPLIEGDSDKARAKNRRVEFKIIQ